MTTTKQDRERALRHHGFAFRDGVVANPSARAWAEGAGDAPDWVDAVRTAELIAAVRRETAAACAEACEAVRKRSDHDYWGLAVDDCAAECREIGSSGATPLTHGAGWRDPEA